MGYYTFPHTRLYDGDLGWLICSVNHLIEQYGDIDTYIQEFIKEHPELVRAIAMYNEPEQRIYFVASSEPVPTASHVYIEPVEKIKIIGR